MNEPGSFIHLATVAGAERGTRFRVHAPLLELTKADTVRRGRELGVDFALTHTCYDQPSGFLVNERAWLVH